MAAMTTEELMTYWATASEASMKDDRPDRALVYELRALRLMWREEIREAAWPLKQWAEVMGKPVTLLQRTGTWSYSDGVAPDTEIRVDE